MVKRGLKAEQRVAASLRAAGAKVKLSPGSKTSADFTAKWNTGKKWVGQIKYSGKKTPAKLSSNAKSVLLNRAKRNSATPVYVPVTPQKIKYLSARDGRKLRPRG